MEGEEASGEDVETDKTEVEEFEEVMEDGEGEGEAERGHEGREEGEEDGEIAGEEVTVEELPEAENVEASRPEERAERYV